MYKLIKVFIAITLPLLICATKLSAQDVNGKALACNSFIPSRGGAPVTLLYLFKADTYDTYEIKGDEDNHYLAKGYTDSYELTNENILLGFDDYGPFINRYNLHFYFWREEKIKEKKFLRTIEKKEMRAIKSTFPCSVYSSHSDILATFEKKAKALNARYKEKKGKSCDELTLAEIAEFSCTLKRKF